MKKLLNKFLSIVFFCGLSILTIHGQESELPEVNAYESFLNLDGSTAQFTFFFNSSNRYQENSAYDWIDSVNDYKVNAEKNRDSTGIRNYMLIQSQILHDLGDFDKGLTVAKEVYDDIDSLDIEQKAALLNIMDRTYGQLELYDNQMDIREKKKELGIIKNVYFYDIYSNLGMYRAAIDDYYDKIKPNVNDKDSFAQADFYNNIGNFLRLDGSTPTALSNYKKAYGYTEVYINDIMLTKTEKEETKGFLLKGKIEGNIGKCHAQMKNYELAIPKLENSLELIKEHSAGKYSQDFIENSLALAECYIQLEDFEKATDYLSDDLDIKRTIDVLKKNRLFAAFYEKTGDYNNSTQYFKKNLRIHDSLAITSSEVRKQMLASVMGRDMKNNQEMISKQRALLEQGSKDALIQKKRNDYVIISLVLTLLFLAGLVYAYMRSLKNQRLIARQKEIIESSLVEKDSLLKEIHHRVKNNLQMVSSLLSLQTKNTRSKAAIEALEEGKSRVKAMALIHQKLYQHDDLSVIEMQGYIESLINSVQSVYKKGGHNINITIDAEDVQLDIDRAIPFGLILNELVSNSFKYAFPNDEENGKIYIHLRRTKGEEGFFEYTDNGIGLPEDTDERANSSMGLRLMNRLANQLQTVLNVDKSNEGVRFWFNFK
ncbi:histidine kinase [Aurantibacter crassamenti]|uniref:tetratricopeptide repeat-containing sensor histidine kinase n=1 Tax=Aurantibacter crassamenti TaxID=1837375 RepID=UPI001939F1BB|nr:histidine kinase dimerization/phosphoacceptor domain -containing protein [Aurantibacter crassamenti]MBM1107417.1 histidine kinase [Aurantibacter crassamenti]